MAKIEKKKDVASVSINIYQKYYDRLESQLDYSEFALIVTMQGAEAFRRSYKVVKERFDKANEKEKKELQSELLKAKSLQDNAKSVVVRQGVFNLLVATWSYFEAFVYDFSSDWVLENKFQNIDKNLANTKIFFVDFINLSKQEKVQKLFEEFEKKNNSWGKNSVDRFEDLLCGIGLAGKLDANIKRDFIEWVKVRNLIVHRGGFVDKKFLNECGWFNEKKPRKDKAKVGQLIYISPDDYDRYKNAALKYAENIGKRCQKSMNEKTKDSIS